MNKKILTFILLIGILSIAFLLRSKTILSGDFYFLSDQSRDLLLVREMIDTGKPPLIGARAGFGGLFHGPLWIWLLSIPYLLVKGDPLKISYFFVFISMALILLSYLIGTKLYGKKMGLFFALLITSSPILINTVPFTTNAQVMPIIFLLFLSSLILYIRGNKKCIYFAAFFSGLGFQFESAFSVLLLPYIFIISFLTDRYLFKIRNFIIGLISFMLPLITFIIFELKHKFLMTNSVIRLLTDTESHKPMKGYEQYGDIFFRIKDRIQLLLNSPSTVIENNQLINIILLLIIGVSIYLVYKNKEKRVSKKEFFSILFLPIYIFGIYVFYPFPIWEHYIFSIPVLIALILTISFYVIPKYFIGKIVVLIFLLSVLFPLILSAKTNVITFNKTTALGSDGSYKNQLAVADYVFNDAKGEKFGYFVYTAQIFTYGMDYLLGWRGKYTYNYLPVSQKKDPFYLIMYPPISGDENAHNFWTKNTIRTKGKVLKREVLNGNIIVEKRIPEEKEEPINPNYYLNFR